MQNQSVSIETPIALVVDDDFIARNMMSFSLRSAGFQCVDAENGNDALAKLSAHDIKLVVTDLKMPGRNGHSLAIELLQRTTPPVIAVHTSFDDPRLAEDLMARGVDDIVYKPTNYKAFAGKMKGMVARRRELLDRGERSRAFASNDWIFESTSDPLKPVTLGDLKSRLLDATHLLPLSPAALDVLNLLRDDECAPPSQIARIIERDSSLCCEVLRIASSSSIPTEIRSAIALEDAIAKIGTRRIAEAAVALNAMRLFTPTVLPWLDVTVASTNGLAAQIALNHICQETGRGVPADGLVLAAIMNASSRVLMGMLYPHTYQALVETCTQQGSTLSQMERAVFPVTPMSALSEMLANWNVPSDLCHPLKYVGDNFAALARLPESMRLNVELLKTAMILGQCASGRWHSWEAIEFPPEAVLQRLRIPSLADVITSVRSELSRNHNNVEPRTPVTDKSQTITYCNLSPHSSELLVSVVESFGISLREAVREGRSVARRSLVNCIGTPSTRLAVHGVLAQHSGLLMITDTELPVAFSASGEILQLPASYSALKSACLRMLS